MATARCPPDLRRSSRQAGQRPPPPPAPPSPSPPALATAAARARAARSAPAVGARRSRPPPRRPDRPRRAAGGRQAPNRRTRVMSSSSPAAHSDAARARARGQPASLPACLPASQRQPRRSSASRPAQASPARRRRRRRPCAAGARPSLLETRRHFGRPRVSYARCRDACAVPIQSKGAHTPQDHGKHPKARAVLGQPVGGAERPLCVRTYACAYVRRTLRATRARPPHARHRRSIAMSAAPR